MHPRTSYTTSVCTGALLLGAAGLLDGKNATTHWTAHDRLRAFGAHPIDQRVVHDGKIITAAGVSAGIDLALTVVAQLTEPDIARAIQLGIEYAPHPPFDSGTPATAPAPTSSTSCEPSPRMPNNDSSTTPRCSTAP